MTEPESVYRFMSAKIYFHGEQVMTSELEAINRKKTGRIDYIDVFRALGILFMVMGHIGFGKAFDHFIHAFHMPMFFWISGWFFCSRSKEELPFGSFVLKKARTLLLPYLVFGLAHFVFRFIEGLLRQESIGFEPLLHLFSDNTEKIAVCGAIWFLTALFFADIIFFLIDRYVKNSAFRAILVVGLALFGNFAGKILPFKLPLALGQGFVGVGLYYIGYLCKKYSGKKAVGAVLKLSLLPCLVLCAAAAALIFANGYINMRTGAYSFVPLFWLNAVLSIIAGFNLSRLIYKPIQNCFIGKWLTEIGRDSIVYVCMNQAVIRVFENLIFVDEAYPSALKLALKVLILILSLAVLYLIDKLIMKTGLRVLVGKR